MNQLPQPALVSAETVSPVEAPRSGAAQRAAALRVQRKAVQKGSAAAYAEILGRQRLRLSQAFRAHRDAGDFGEGAMADPALVRKQE